MEYLNDKDIVDISKIIKNNKIFLAHIKENNKETLKEHTDLCNKYFFKIYNAKNLDNVLKNFQDNYLTDFNEKQIDLFKRLVVNVINFHDIGKINPTFQRRKMDNTSIDDIHNEVGSKHSILSAVLYIDYFIEEVNQEKSIDKKAFMILSQILFINAYVISRHHGKLSDFSNFLNLFYYESGQDGVRCIDFLNENYDCIYEKEIGLSAKILYKKIKNVKKSMEKNNKEQSICVYVYTKLMYSVLIACDFYATTEFMEGIELDEFGEIGDISEIYNVYKENEIYKNIRKYEKNEYTQDRNLSKENDINTLRTEMFLDSERELLKNIDKNIFFLEAPTGSGKSNTSINLSFKILEEESKTKKIYYIYPFNTLIEQNTKSLEDIFTNEDEMLSRKVLSNIAVINSLNPIKVEQEEFKKEEKKEECNYNYYTKALLNRQFLNYPIILSTHVSLFNTMFASNKENAIAFYQLANSVIVLDEIQSYKNTIWSEIIIFLNMFSKILNIKVIIMSATLPNLDYLLGSNENVVQLIKDREKYFLNGLFKNRVAINYELIKSDINDLFSHVKEKSKNNKKILIEFIKKQSAYDFYDMLKNDSNIKSPVELLSGDDNVIERQRILNKVATSDNIVLVATQVIEAGVDIDMDIGYKDISKLDSEEQFMGRINRSCKKNGIVYFFDEDKADKIYKNDIRINKIFTLEDDTMKDILINKNFQDYYKLVMDILRNNHNNSFSEYNLDEFFNREVAVLNFGEVENRMKLIEENMWSMSVYLSRKLELDGGEVLDGEKIWNEYKRLLNDRSIGYAQKEVELSRIRSLLNYFIYDIKKTDLIYNDRIGELYFIEDGESYFKEGKIDKEKLTTGIGDFI